MFDVSSRAIRHLVQRNVSNPLTGRLQLRGRDRSEHGFITLIVFVVTLVSAHLYNVVLISEGGGKRTTQVKLLRTHDRDPRLIQSTVSISRRSPRVLDVSPVTSYEPTMFASNTR